MRRIRNSITELINLFPYVTQNGVRLVDEVGLEAEVVDDVGAVPRGWDDVDEVDEWDAAVGSCSSTLGTPCRL